MNLLHLRLTVFVLYFYKFLTLAAFIQEVRSNPLNPFQIRPSYTPRLVKQTCHCRYCTSIFVACSNISQKVTHSLLIQLITARGKWGQGGGGLVFGNFADFAVGDFCFVLFRFFFLISVLFFIPRPLPPFLPFLPQSKFYLLLQ